MAAEPRELAGVVIAFDGSDASRAALERAAELFPGRAAVIATVWEPGLALQLPVYDSFGSMAPPLDPETVAEVDRAQRDHATQVARAGAELATSLGLAAGPRPVEDEVDVADTLVDIADKTGAAAIVIGSHGVTGLRSHIVGSVARKLLSHCRCPVVVVRYRE
jgi:nucleotide-binding universal stress UspA family protein